MTKNPTEVGVLYGAPSNYVYVQPPLSSDEVDGLVERGIVKENQIMVVTEFLAPISLIAFREAGIGGKTTRQQAKAAVQAIALYLEPNRGEVVIEPEAQSTLGPDLE
jgi:hypothetical protein